MSFITDLFSGGASKLVDSVGKVLDNVITTKEERQLLDNEIQKAEMQYKIDIAKLSIEEQQAILGDIQNARNREVEIQRSENATKLSKNLMAYMTLGTIVMCFAMFFVLIFAPSLVKVESREILFYILGIVSGILVQVYSYHFGSSSGSASKEVTIKNMKNIL